MYEVVKNYQDNQKLRHSFNKLAGETFGLNFEDWYQNGFWRENYIPYSVVYENEVVANVSVNITDMMWNGERKQFIQLGTVMTKESHRQQGLIRRLMAEIEKDFGQKADGMYLFANDNVLDFYPKFGFGKAVEYQYSKAVEIHTEKTMVQLSMKDKAAWSELENAINKSVPCGNFEMVDNSGLYMFYVTKFMQENVYYYKKMNAYVIAEQENDTLLIHNIFAEEKVDLDEIIEAFGKEIKNVVLGFVPQEREGYLVNKIVEEDTTLFIKGDGFAAYEKERLMFPTLAHA